MSINRQNNPFNNNSNTSPLENGAFAMCPEVFLEKLTPEQYRSQQELYRRAYDKARGQSQEKASGDNLSFEI